MNEYLEQIRRLKESEDHIEFKEAKKDFNYNGGEHKDLTKLRHCILGYVVAVLSSAWQTVGLMRLKVLHTKRETLDHWRMPYMKQ